MSQITEKKAIEIFNKQYGVSRLRQLLKGSATICGRHYLKPCPKCHGNDRLVEGPQAPGFTHALCERRNHWYLG